MEEKIGQINAPSDDELLDVTISGPFKNGSFRLDLIGAEGDSAGMPWMQLGKNVEEYTPPDTEHKYVLLKNYSEARGYPHILYLAGIVDYTGRSFMSGYNAEFIEATINDGTEREYELVVSWSEVGVMSVTATSRAEAVEKAHKHEGLPDGEYIDGSFEVSDRLA